MAIAATISREPSREPHAPTLASRMSFVAFPTQPTSHCVIGSQIIRPECPPTHPSTPRSENYSPTLPSCRAGAYRVDDEQEVGQGLPDME